MSTQRTRYTTDHAAEQFRIRATGGAGVAPAWERGLRVDIPDGAPVPRHDEARYDARSDLVVFRRERTLTTCYGLEPKHLTNIHGVAVAAVVDEQFGTDYRSGIDAANLGEVKR
ncbi:hypothetical protein DJ73_13005 [Halorubrum sp. Ea1]|uniref:hypothetical protein n=1 Tax=Halorubrum sp. Ea1 TaxID=1480718 RepID=UPI000B9944D0|nr:hypothetical protein [Halorubrum sp. Ea1]OYR51511.1 hypothetical protein DJ73_13005 [Halorubrum sp. Ea1]